jgi:hypothetical protein
MAAYPVTFWAIISVIKKHYSTDDLEMKPPLITNMMQRKDISKYIYKYFIKKDEKENFVKGIVKWEQKLDKYPVTFCKCVTRCLQQFNNNGRQ